MTAEKLQDAISLLPSDLIAATDRRRAAPKTSVIHWKRWVSLAACLVLLLSTGMVFQRKILPGMGGKKEAAAEEPMAMAPRPESQKTTADAAAPEEAAMEAPAAAASAQAPAAEAVPEAPAENGTITEIPAEEALSIDHSHNFAEESEEERATGGYCGNLRTVVSLDGVEHSLYGGDSAAMTDILTKLDYNPNEVCRCASEFTVDTELLTGIEVNLTQGFARCDKGQAAMTEKQVQRLWEIMDNLP